VVASEEEEDDGDPPEVSLHAITGREASMHPKL
jgi:hypothetical protein